MKRQSLGVVLSGWYRLGEAGFAMTITKECDERGWFLVARAAIGGEEHAIGRGFSVEPTRRDVFDFEPEAALAMRRAEARRVSACA